MMLLHTCCADCALKILDSIHTELKLNPADISLYFYNPNIHPESEFHARRKALTDVFQNKGYKLIIAPWQPAHFFTALNGKTDPANRCPKCWYLRLNHTFSFAKEYNYDTISTTLLSSKYHDMIRIKKYGETLAKSHSLRFYVPQNINKDASHAGFYKQNYSGCVYSLLEKMHSKYLKPENFSSP
jgi:epoxyqueuosine reductase